MDIPYDATADAKPTAAPISPGESGAILPEFGRVPDVERIWGIKRGLLYSLIKQGAIKSAVIRRKGARTGIRLIQLQSVRDYVTRQLS
jgi:hypothetical protein